jgi:predicted PurR-regulated permease PerM
VLIAVLIGAQVAGVLGALGAIPIAGAIQVILVDWHEHRRRRGDASAGQADASADGALPEAPSGAVAAARS